MLATAVSSDLRGTCARQGNHKLTGGSFGAVGTADMLDFRKPFQTPCYPRTLNYTGVDDFREACFLGISEMVS